MQDGSTDLESTELSPPTILKRSICTEYESVKGLVPRFFLTAVSVRLSVLLQVQSTI